MFGLKMRILFSITYYFPYISGLTIYCQRLAEALAARRYKCTVLTAAFAKKLPSQETVEKIRVLRVPYLLKISKGFFLPKWPWVAWQLVRMTDVVIINLPQFEGFVPALWARILGKKVISIYHCEVCLPSGLVNKLAEGLLHLANLISLSLSHKVVTYTEDYAKHSPFLPYFKKKLLFVYPPIQITENRKQKTVRSRKREEEVRIGFAGRIAAEKGIEYLLAALPLVKCSRYKNIKLIIAGPKPVGEERYGRKLQALIKKYKDYLVFTGPLRPLEEPKKNCVKFPTIVQNFHQLKTMEDFYQAIDVLVLPSVNSTEAFGMVQVEAMIYGVPVVASNLPGVRVPIQKTGMGILVPPRNSQAIARTIGEILNNRQKYLKSRKLVEKIFDFEKTIKFYEKLLRE